MRIALEGFTNSSVFGCGSLPVISETLLRLSWFRMSVAGRIFREAIVENSGLDWTICPCSTFDSRRFPKLSQSRRRHTQNGFSRCPAKRLRPSCSTQLSNISTKACALRKNDRNSLFTAYVSEVFKRLLRCPLRDFGAVRIENYRQNYHATCNHLPYEISYPD